MSGYIDARAAVLLKKETTPGTYDDPTVALPIERGDGLWVPEFDTDEFDPLSAHHGSKETTVITAFATMPVELGMKLPDDHTLIADALAGCGMSAADVNGVTVYTYDSANKTTVSLKQVGERTTTKAYGERGTFTISAEAGKAARITFEYNGSLLEQTKLAASAAPNTVPSTPAFSPVFMTKECTAYLVNGNQAHFTKVEFKLGGDVGVPKDTCAGEAWTKDIKPELSVTMMDSIDNAQSFADLKNGTEFNFVIPFFDVNGNKKWELVAPRCVVIAHKTPEEEGRISLERTFECRKVNGDDNFELRAY